MFVVSANTVDVHVPIAGQTSSACSVPVYFVLAMWEFACQAGDPCGGREDGSHLMYIYVHLINSIE